MQESCLALHSRVHEKSDWRIGAEVELETVAVRVCGIFDLESYNGGECAHAIAGFIDHLTMACVPG